MPLFIKNGNTFTSLHTTVPIAGGRLQYVPINPVSANTAGNSGNSNNNNHSNNNKKDD